MLAHVCLIDTEAGANGPYTFYFADSAAEL